MKKTTRNILIVVGSIVLAIGIVLAIVLPLTLGQKPDAEHTVTFESNGGSEVASVTVKHGSTVDEPAAPTRTGYTFKGWFSDSALKNAWTFAADTVKSDITLYAKWTYDATEGLSFTLNQQSNTYTVSGMGSATDKDIVIPSQYNNLPVTTIAANAFKGLGGVESVFVPFSITSIKNGAFSDCANLVTATLDCNAEMESGVFSNCAKLQTVVLPTTLTQIPANTFRTCVNLAEVQIPSTVTDIGAEAFFDCKKLSAISFPDGLVSLGDKAFAGCSAFTSVNLPASVTGMGENVFSGCRNIETLTVDAHNSYFFGDGNCIIYRGVGEGGSALNTLVVGCKTSVIPTNVRIIGRGAFQGCQNLENISIPGSVTEIGDHAFEGCVGLTRVNIPSSVTKIGDYAFSNCSYLETVVFSPKSTDNDNVEYGVKSFGREAFSHCFINSFNIPDSVTFIGAGVFYGNSRLTTLTYSGSSDDWRANVRIGTVEQGEVNIYNGSIQIRFTNTSQNIVGLVGND